MFSQGNWQRAWASESDEALKKGAWLAAGLVLPLVFVMGFLGTVVAGQGAVSEPSAAFFYLIEDAGVLFVAAFIVLAVALACSSVMRRIMIWEVEILLSLFVPLYGP